MYAGEEPPSVREGNSRQVVWHKALVNGVPTIQNAGENFTRLVVRVKVRYKHHLMQPRNNVIALIALRLPRCNDNETVSLHLPVTL